MILKYISLLSLLVTILPSVFYFFDLITLDLSKIFMLIGTVLWFVTAPKWINND